ncbi:MAG: FeoC-like transcriptional regulator [Acidimicrobiia bacterium]
MTILDRLLDELESATGPVRSDELACRLQVAASALEGMVRMLESKGLVPAPRGTPPACSPSCGIRCPGVETCPFPARLVRRQP